MHIRFAPLLLALAAFTPLGAAAHTRHAPAGGTTSSPAKEQKPWGIAGDARAVRRTIAIRMSDDMRFTPDRIEVREGETVRFVVRNAGKVMHEIVIGTKQDLDQHAAMMVKFPNMEHDEPYMAHVAPGKKGELVWNFNRPGRFDYACLIAGHYQAGMVGQITVIPRNGGSNSSSKEPTK